MPGASWITGGRGKLAAIVLSLAVLAGGLSEADAARRHSKGPLDLLQSVFQPKKKPVRSHRRPAKPPQRRPAAAGSKAVLPATVPAPQSKPAAEAERSAAGLPDEMAVAVPGTIPIPTPRPVDGDAAADQPVPDVVASMPVVIPDITPETLPGALPIPTPRPDDDADDRPAPEPALPEPAAPEPGPPELPAQPTPAAMPKPAKPFVQATAPVVTPEQEAACRVALKSLGVVFTESAPQSDPIGCRMDHPIAVSSLGPAVKLSAPLVTICPLAEVAARFSQQVIVPAAQKSFNSPVAEISETSSYVCRSRHGSGKLSQHAFGNAIDIGSMVLADGRRIAVKADSDPVRRDFLDGIERAACGPFKTVLGPGSDADHALHFHLDLEQRRNGATYCH